MNLPLMQCGVSRMLTAVVASAGVMVVGLLGVPTASADTASVSTPVGSLEMTIDGGSFTEECTDFPYEIVVTGALPRVQWSAEIDAERSGGWSVSDSVTGMGSGTTSDDLMICTGDGAGAWTARVAVRMWDTSSATDVYDRTMTLEFTVSKAETTTTITSVSVRSSSTTVKGTVVDAAGGTETTAFGTVTVRVKAPGGSWTTRGSATVAADGTYRVSIGSKLRSGTKVKAVFSGTDASKRSVSAVSEV